MPHAYARCGDWRPPINKSLIVVCGTDPVLGGVFARNLERRGFAVQQLTWEPCHGQPPADVGSNTMMVIADLDCSVADRWVAVNKLDRYFPSVPVVVLDYDRPDAACLQSWRPYRFLRKPLDVRDLLRLVDELTEGSSGC
jgi:hypothetical protein